MVSDSLSLVLCLPLKKIKQKLIMCYTYQVLCSFQTTPSENSSTCVRTQSLIHSEETKSSSMAGTQHKGFKLMIKESVVNI